ncbi:MAG TPA: DUF4082 domain-containing protein [Candidatus Saccharimonadales bacterium]
MKKHLKRVAILTIAIVTAVWLPVVMPGGRTAQALSSCPTDPLSHLTPYNTNVGDSSAINVGVKFEVRGAPYVQGVKFYKTTANTGTHIAHLYDVTTSTDLASATFTSETSSGWQSVNFGSNVQVRDDHVYMVWVSMPNGNYAADSAYAGGNNFFDGSIAVGQFGNSEDVVKIPAGNSGVYSYTSNDATVPSNATTANYWVTPVVGDATNPGNSSGYSSSHSGGRTISWSTTGVDTNSATSAGAITRTKLVRQQGEIVDVLGYISGSNSSITDVTATAGTSYTYTVTNVDACGNNSSGSSVMSNTGSAQSYTTLFGSTTPSATDTGQTDPVTVGMRWNTSTAGNVAGVRIYRASGVYPTGTTPLTVGLWDTSGNLLASRSLLPGNQQSGWINVAFSSPVSVSANTDYVVGYYSPNGREEYTNDVFDSAVTNGSLTAPADTVGARNGVYSANSTMSYPSTASPNNTWYGVDVNFYIP